MCGFVVVCNRDDRAVEQRMLEAMAKKIAHRGPDGEGMHLDGPIGLAHKRLAVIDIAGGAQPMVDASGHYWIVYNGEIYNHVELRKELQARGVQLRTHSDTEVLLELFVRDGPDCVTRLNGMFSFFVYDRKNQRAFAARDHFGIKPLYYYIGSDFVVFASEPKAILAHPSVEARLDPERVGDYLSLQLVLGEGSLFEGISQVLPGHHLTLELSNGDLRTQRFWEPTYAVDDTIDEDEAVETLDALVQDAVRIQLRSDVPVGSYLSGGLDSSLVTALARRHSPAGFKSFHGRFLESPRFDESPFAEIVAERTDTALQVHALTAERFAEALPEMIYYMDQPAAGPGLYAQYEMAQHASRGVTVVLGGQGGDEVFCGYTRYFIAYMEQALKGAIFQTADAESADLPLTSILGSLPQLQEYVPMLQRFWRDGLFDPIVERYFRLIDRTEDASHLYTGSFLETARKGATFDRFQQVFNRTTTKSYISKMRDFDRMASLPALLHVEDRVSMAHSLESRVPLLDYRIADYVDRLRPGIIFREGRHKHLLREVAARYLPWEIVHRRDKMGFPVPLDMWLKRGPVRDFVRDTLRSRACRERGIIDVNTVDQHLDGAQPFSRALWGVLCLELWHQIFIDGEAG